MADTPRPMNISDACTEIFRLEGMVRELRAERARDKEALPVVAWRTVIRVRALDIIYHYAETPPEGDDLEVEWQLLTDHATATAALSELRAEMQQQALRSLTSEGEWIEMTGELRAEVERRGDVIRGHEATLTRLQGDLLRERLKKEAAEQLYKNEVEMSGAEVERLKALLHRVRVEVGRIELGETLSDEIDVAIDTARSAASGESAEGGT